PTTPVHTATHAEPPRGPAPPPPPVVRPKAIDEPQRSRVELKDLPPLSAPPPSAPGGGRLALAAEATGEGDAFNLAGNPVGRGLLSGGGLGGGTGVGSGGGGGSPHRLELAKAAARSRDR